MVSHTSSRPALSHDAYQSKNLKSNFYIYYKTVDILENVKGSMYNFNMRKALALYWNNQNISYEATI